MASNRYEIDMCSGPLLPKMLRFAFPLMLSGVLQLFFNAADIIVVGQFSGKEALAAVGSTGALINLLVNVFVGLSVGTNVLVARYVGARDEKNVSDTVHTSIMAGLIGGGILVCIGLLLAKPLLVLMGTPDDVLGQAALYVRIYFLSMPAVMLYNFGAAVLRAVGDTTRPLYFLTIAGVVNVLCNLFFVIVLDWGVAGVAVATSIAQIISASLVMRCLMEASGSYRLDWNQLKLHREKLLEMMRIGLPAGLQGALFSLSNVVIQSSINSFGSVAMAGNAAAGNIEGFIWTSMSGFCQANLSFTSQNIGARTYSRLNRITLLSVTVVVIVSMALGTGIYMAGDSLLGIYNSDPAVIAFGLRRFRLVGRMAFIGSIMEAMMSGIRGMGYSIMPTIVSLAGVCGFRVVWIFTVFAMNPTPEVLYISYPVSWFLTAMTHTICYLMVRRKLPKKDAV